MTGTSLVTYSEEWAKLANQFKTQVPVASGDKSLSIRGGVFSEGEDQLGTMLCAIILDSIAVNTYFDQKWVEGVKAAPKCYAYGRPPEEMKPHIESMQLHMDHFYPQTLNPTTGEIGGCQSCKWNQFGSAGTGKGKACQNRDRLALLPAGMFVQDRASFGYKLQLFDDPAHFQNEKIRKVSLPVTSGRNWREFAQKVITTTGRPPFGVIAVLELKPHPKFQTEVVFHMQELVPDHLFQIVTQRYAEAAAGMIEPFSPAKDEEPPQNTNVQPQGRAVMPPATAQGLRR